MHRISKYLFFFVLVAIVSINSLFLLQDKSLLNSFVEEIQVISNESLIHPQRLEIKQINNVTLFDLINNSTLAAVNSTINQNVTINDELTTIKQRAPEVVINTSTQEYQISTSTKNFSVFLEPSVSTHLYPYLINPQEIVCGPNKGADLLLIAFVPISIGNFAGRNSIRHTWANYNSLKNMKVVFLIGNTDNATISKEVFFESNLYGDIIQENFVDSYRNLTLKTLMGLKWVSNYCYNARFVMKVDDDVVVHTLNTLDLLNQIDMTYPTLHNTFLCKYISNATVLRNKTSKFYVSKEEYPLDIFPP
jgi:hypothetical protein